LLWQHIPHRVTKDVDLLGFGDSAPEALRTVFAEICAEPVEDDGVVFEPASVQAEAIRAEEIYVGVRVTLRGMLGSARLHVQVDVGYGDGFAAEPVLLHIPSLIGMPAPEVRAYRMETSIAEKFEAAATLGLLNTRMKDYFDVWHLAKGFAFEGQAISESIRATFERRAKVLPATPTVGFTAEFWSDPRRQAMWGSVLQKVRADQAVSVPRSSRDLRGDLHRSSRPSSRPRRNLRPKLAAGRTVGAQGMNTLAGRLLQLTYRFQGRDFRLTDVHGKVVKGILT
jgi:hypothetical protein